MLLPVEHPREAQIDDDGADRHEHPIANATMIRICPGGPSLRWRFIGRSSLLMLQGFGDDGAHRDGVAEEQAEQGGAHS